MEDARNRPFSAVSIWSNLPETDCLRPFSSLAIPFQAQPQTSVTFSLVLRTLQSPGRFLLNPDRLLIRFGLLGGLVLGLYEAIYLGVIHRGAVGVAGENGPIEIMQASFAVAGAIALFWVATHQRLGRTGIWVSGALLMYAVARESDLLFETIFFEDAYKWLVGGPLVIASSFGNTVAKFPQTRFG